MPGSDLCRCHLAQVTGSRPAEPGSTLMPGHTSSHWARAGRPSKGQLCPLLSAIFATCQEGKPPMERGTACLRMGPQPLSGGAGGEDPGGCHPSPGVTECSLVSAGKGRKWDMWHLWVYQNLGAFSVMDMFSKGIAAGAAQYTNFLKITELYT